jgi:hypothetical protein
MSSVDDKKIELPLFDLSIALVDSQAYSIVDSE